MVSILINGLICVLLVVTIYFAYTLNKRLKTLTDSKEEFEKLVTDLNQATGRAEGGVYALKASAKELSQQLQDKIERGQKLNDELAFILERGDGLANKLTNKITEPRKKRSDKKAAETDQSSEILEADEEELIEKLKALR